MLTHQSIYGENHGGSHSQLPPALVQSRAIAIVARKNNDLLSNQAGKLCAQFGRSPCQTERYVTPAEGPMCPNCSILSLSQGPAPGKPGASATACCNEPNAAAAAMCSVSATVLGCVAADLAGLEAGFDPHTTGDCRSLASGTVQDVLDLAFPTSEACREKVCRQGIARVDLSQGC